jgi:uncharacterized damage-inducible protein DinB
MSPAAEMIRTLYAYNTWANQRILDSAANLSAEQFTTQVRASFDSVRNTLVHIMSVQQNWLVRAQSMPSVPMLHFEDYPTFDSVHSHWNDIDAQTHQFVDNLNETQLASIIRYVNNAGEPNAYPLWQLLTHQVTHAQQHRSEIAIALTEFGYSPGWLDFLIYIDTVQHLD